MFEQLIFYFPVLGWRFKNITVMTILEVDMICLSNFIFNNTFVMAA